MVLRRFADYSQTQIPAQMPTNVVLEFVFATITALCGLAGGWYIRGSFLRRSDDEAKPNAANVALKKSREALTKLQETAVNMAADVGRHNTRVQEINAELTSLDSQRPEDVGAAVAKVLEANERMQQLLVKAEEKLHEQALQIESHVAEARTDALTGAANRRAFDDEMTRCLDEYQRRGRAFCLMMVDIDAFKNFNDMHGHQAGDHVLKCVVRVLKMHVSKLEMVARYGGEEFAVIFPDSNLASAKPMAERARAAIAAAAIEFDGMRLQVTASAGLAESLAGEDAAAIVKRADAALYDSKKAGRNCGHWHDGEASHQIKVVAPKPASAPITTPAPVSPVSVAGGASGKSGTAEALRDPLTGLSTRAVFCEDVNRRVAERKRGGPPVTAMFARIDRFDELTPRFGGGTSETVLRAVTQFLKATMRDMDHVARYDHDVFALLLPGATLDDSVKIGERLRRAIDRCRLPIGGDEHVKFTVSVGIAEASRTDSGERLLEHTTAAMKTSLAAGGNKSHVFTGKEIELVAEEEPVAVAT